MTAEEVEGEELFRFDIGDQNRCKDKKSQQQKNTLLFILREG